MGIYRSEPFVERGPVKRLVLIVTLLLLALSVTACAPETSGTNGGDGLHSIVPDVVGLDEADAATALAEAGYTVGEISTDPSADAEPGTVIEQTPIASTSAPRDSAVDLVVAGP